MHRPAMTRRRFLSASAALAGAGLGACAYGRPVDPDAPRGGPADEPPADPTAAAALAAGNTRFGLDLYGRLREAPGNLFLSPFSISTALAMTAAGARGTTLDEMREVLRLPADPHPAFRALLAGLAPAGGGGRPFDLAVANAIWAQKGYPWRDEFKRLVADHYRAGANDAEFVGDPDGARKAINLWVQKQTRDVVKDLIPPDVVTALTRMVLTNAIYFKGQWAGPFDKPSTKPQPFHLAGGGTADAPLMYRMGPHRYAEGDGYQVLDLPYRGDRVSMTVFLPAKPDGLPALEKALTADRLAEDLGRLRTESRVHVHLPRFKAEKQFRLKEPLQAMGMKAAFGAADFSGMHTGTEHLQITEVVHKAVVEVDEEGTTAAAGTAVVVGRAPSPPPPPPKVFRADRPFLFLLRDAATDTVLFLGRLTDPRG